MPQESGYRLREAATPLLAAPTSAEPSDPSDALLQQALDLLACPACLHPLRAQETTLTCTQCSRAYPLVDGIPILLVDLATLL